MVDIRLLESSPPQAWGVFDDTGQQILFIDEEPGHPACEVRVYEPHHARCRGKLLVTFLGVDSFAKACEYVVSVQSLDYFYFRLTS